MILLMTQTQYIQQIKVGQVQYNTSQTCIFMWLNRYHVSMICETWSHINPHTNLYYNSVFHTYDIRLGTIKSFNNNHRVSQLKSFHTYDIRLGTIKSFNNNHRVSQLKSSTQIIHKILKLKE
jgi:hypothetical protein